MQQVPWWSGIFQNSPLHRHIFTIEAAWLTGAPTQTHIFTMKAMKKTLQYGMEADKSFVIRSSSDYKRDFNHATIHS